MDTNDIIFKHSILITGGAGFIGSHLSIYLTKKYRNYKIVVIDKLDYCSNINNLNVVINDFNFKFYKGNILDECLLNKIFCDENIDMVFHLAAYTHVDNSFKNPIKFTENNVLGTHYLLEVCKSFNISKFIYISTDEVYGEGEMNGTSLLNDTIECNGNCNNINNHNNSSSNNRDIIINSDDFNNSFSNHNNNNNNNNNNSIDIDNEIEQQNNNHNHNNKIKNKRSSEIKTILKPTNPYSASKASAEHLVQSYYKSFKLPIIITRGNNVYGPKQYPEKIIPKFITLLLNNKKCTIHGNGNNKRSYLYIDDIIDALDIILNHGKIGEIYNIGTDFEISNNNVAKTLINQFINHNNKNHYININNNNNNLNNNNKENQIEYNKYIKYINDRPFNDYRYNINYSKISKLGWKKSIGWEEGIKLTFNWYTTNQNYWSNINEILNGDSIDKID